MGKDKYFSVPLGTEVYEIKKSNPSKSLQTSDEEYKLKIADLDQEGQFIQVARGGKGGPGNMTVRS